MNIVCEHGEKIVRGLNIYILCHLTNSPCSFQKWCIPRQDVLNTEGAKTCVARSKKLLENEEVVNDIVETSVDVKPEEEIPVKKNKKEYGIVVLVSKSGVYFNYNGQSRYKAGKFKFKVGDKIEL
jgi:hypothetical protein